VKCSRCGDEANVWSMSFFNTDKCCMPCLDDEEMAPTYPEAKDAERQAVLRGDYNYSHGLTPSDHAFLGARLAARAAGGHDAK